MKYLFGVAFLFLLYAVAGILLQGASNAAVPKAAQPLALVTHGAREPTPFKIIRVVDDRAPPVLGTKTDLGNQPEVIGLAAAIQQRLAEANCYAGPIDGVWSDATRDAARRFIAAARAELLSDGPDDGLLALLNSRGDDKSLCSWADSAEQASNSSTPVRNADAIAELGPPMGLGASGSSGYSIYASRGDDRSFRHPLGGF